jgi:hypothetical protein
MSRTGKIWALVAAMIIVALIGYQLVKGQTVAVTRHWSGSYDPKPGRPASRVLTYKVYWGTDSLTFTNNPATGTVVPYTATPADSGKADSVAVPGLPADTRVYYAVAAVDSAGNVAPWSNIYAETTPDRTAPKKVVDLH